MREAYIIYRGTGSPAPGAAHFSQTPPPRNPLCPWGSGTHWELFGGLSGGLLGPEGAPQTVQEGSGTVPECCTASALASRQPKRAPRCPKRPSRGPLEASKSLPRAILAPCWASLGDLRRSYREKATCPKTYKNIRKTTISSAASRRHTTDIRMASHWACKCRR